ncbi:MAG: hypothetical protein JWR67_1785 [Mucilaginibacter sp.]|nr:hypothetical protein [Mucilaginibacter sp.]
MPLVCSAVLYGFAKVLNEIAAGYLSDWMIWISDMSTQNNNPHLPRVCNSCLLFQTSRFFAIESVLSSIFLDHIKVIDK